MGGTSDNAAFSGFTAPANAPGQTESRLYKAAVDSWLSEQEQQPAWRALYDELLTERTEAGRPRWDWRRALYIAWRSVPPMLREPKYERGLIGILGLTSTRTIRQWREKDPGIEERIAALPREMLLDHVSGVMAALVQVASDASPQAHPDRKLFLEMTGYYTPKSKQENTGDVTFRVEYGDDGSDDSTA